MSFNGTVAFEHLAERLPEIWDGIERDCETWQVITRENRAFVIGPPSICGRVLGLYDSEYGWPREIHVDGAFSLQDVVPRPRHHPFIMRGGRCVAVVVSAEEYRDILKSFALFEGAGDLF